MDNTATEALEKVTATLRTPDEAFADAMARMAQAARDAAISIAKGIAAASAALHSLSERLPDITAMFSLEARAMLWASNKRPEWLTIYNRTKKRRTRKKYRDRIMRAYEEALANE